MNAARVLAEIVAQRGTVCAAAFGPNAELESLSDTGFIDQLGVVQTVLCNECEIPHDAELRFEAGQYGICCPDLGFIPKERSEVAAIKANVHHLVENLASELECKRSKSTPVHGDTWRIGVMPGTVADVAVYFHPVLRDGSDLMALKDALTRETRTQFGIVITAAGSLSSPPFQSVLLEDCVAFDSELERFTVELDLPLFAGVPVKKKGGRPSPYAHNLTKIILARRNSGQMLPGINAEARAILSDYQTIHENGPVPSLSAIKQAMKKT